MEPDSITAALPSTEKIFGGSLTPQVGIATFVLIVLIICSALVSGSEFAFFSLSPAKKDEIKDSSNKSFRLINRLLKTPDKLLSTILVSQKFIYISIIILSTFLIHSLTDFSQFTLLGFFIEVVLISSIILFFGEILPKIFMSDFSLGFASIMAFPLNAAQKLFAPFVWTMTSVTKFVNKRYNHSKTFISVDDLNQALELTDEKELSDNKTILKEIIKFGSTNVEQVMTPRIDVVAIEIDDSYHKLINLINNNGYSRIPVYTESFDHISGILYIKDLLPHYHELETFRWQSIIRPPYFVPENKKIDDLLEEFRKSKVHMAIVVDEYGGTSGIITLEDILEEIVGDITDELDDNENQLYSKVNPNTYLFDAKIPLVDFCRICDLDFDLFKLVKGDADTLAGLILEIKGEFPKLNETITFDPLHLTIEAIDKRRIKKVKVTLNRPA